MLTHAFLGLGQPTESQRTQEAPIKATQLNVLMVPYNEIFQLEQEKTSVFPAALQVCKTSDKQF